MQTLAGKRPSVPYEDVKFYNGDISDTISITNYTECVYLHRRDSVIFNIPKEVTKEMCEDITCF